MAIYKRRYKGKKSETWRACFAVKKRRYDLSTGCTSKSKAQEWVRAFRHRLALGQVGIVEQKPVPTFKEFSVRFRDSVHTLHVLKPKTVSFYTNSLDRLLEFEPLSESKLDKVDESLVDSYITHRKSHRRANGNPLQVSTINAELRVLKTLLRQAQAWKVIGAVPKIRRLSGEQVRDRVLNQAEIDAYLANAPQPLRDVATVLSQTGMRPEETFRMRWENLHFEPAGSANYGYVLNPFGKTKAARRTIPMTQRVKAVLEMRHAAQESPTEGWVFPAKTESRRVESVKSQHAKALKESGVRAFVLYTLRHTFLTRLGESGADPFTIKTVAGHSSISTSSRYVHPTPETVERAFARFEELSAQKVDTATVQ